MSLASDGTQISGEMVEKRNNHKSGYDNCVLYVCVCVKLKREKCDILPIFMYALNFLFLLSPATMRTTLICILFLVWP